jgi:hypothetical protein
MFELISKWWEKNGFALLVIGSVIFMLVCWMMGWKPKKGRAGKLQDYIGDMFSDKPKRKRNPKKTEERCREIVEDIFQRPFPSVRPDFLRNPETGRNMECDLMNQDMKLCIERNGEQHYKHVDHFHTEADFSKQLQRDKLKAALLHRNGYALITIPYTIHYDILDQYIPHVLGKNPLYKPYVDAYYRRNGITPA